MSLFKHYFKVLSFHLEARIRIQILIRIKLTSRIRLRIRINVIRIRHTASVKQQNFLLYFCQFGQFSVWLTKLLYLQPLGFHFVDSVKGLNPRL
jgi:hypothetical protein